MASASPQAWKIIPEFDSGSITRTIAFYTTHLHFLVGGSHIPPNTTEATFCSLYKGEKAAANIYFRLCNSKSFRLGRAWIAMSTDALEALWAEVKQKEEVKVVEDIDNKEWGYRQFIISDCDGNEITFFCFLDEE